MPELQSAYSRKKKLKNAAEEAATGPSRLSPGRLPALIRPGRGARPEWPGSRPAGASPVPGPSSRPRSAPQEAATPRQAAAIPTRDPPARPAPRAPRPTAGFGPRLLCRQRAAARQRARTPSERPRLFLLPLGRGLMSDPRAPPAPHRRPGRRGNARPGCALSPPPRQLLSACLPAPPLPPPAGPLGPDAAELVVLWLNQFLTKEWGRKRGERERRRERERERGQREREGGRAGESALECKHSEGNRGK